jgi:aspartyl-tRNA synthetase
MSTENLKRSGSLESPQTLAKVPKIENDQVNNEENIVDNINEKVESPKINDVLMKKNDYIVILFERYKFSNQEAIGNLNSKLDKALNILKENSADTCPKFRIFNPKVANVMICCWESFF